MEPPKLSGGGGGTQIDDLPSCLIIDILSRLPIETLVNSRFVCKSWFLLFSDPLFVRLHSARSPTCLLSRRSELKRDLKRYKSVGEMVGKDFKIDIKDRMPNTTFTCVNSCHGLLCLRRDISYNEVFYICNPILGEYITIPTVNRDRFVIINLSSGRFVHNSQAVLGFCSRSNQFKVLLIHYHIDRTPYMAEIYTIGDGTRQWKSIIGIAPRCTTLDIPNDSVSSFLSGSIHWTDGETHQIVYFDFETEQFGSFPGPSAWRSDGRWSEFDKVRVGVSDGCLCIYGFRNLELMESWVMKEYGVQESWTKTLHSKLDLFYSFGIPAWRYGETITYSPSFISLLQDFAGSENVTVLSRTRTKDQDSPKMISNIIFRLWE